MESPNAPAGWYPSGDGSNQYWDGEKWLDIPEPPGKASSPRTLRAPRRPSKRAILAAAIASAIVVAAGAGLIAAKMGADAEAAREVAAREEQAERDAERKADREEAAARAEAEAEAEAKAAADEAERAVRAATVVQIEESIVQMATKHVEEGLIDGPVLGVSCSPVAGGSLDDLSETTTVFECFMSRVDNGDGTSSGHYYNATMNWGDGSYTYGFGRP